jgi:hypothetical protein
VKIDGPQSEAVLSDDFAHRVVRRVRKAKRRRRLYRWALTSAVACTVAIVAILSLQDRNLPPQLPAFVATRNDAWPERVAPPFELGASPEFDSASFAQPLAFFFPGATAVADFQSSSTTYWHSYDPWWNPNP